jgi:hypothetical protein
LDRVPAVLQRLGRPNLLTPRTIIPTTATLSAFAMIVLLIGSLGAVGASFATEGTTITEPAAKHPVASQIPESYAGAIDDPEIATSPEILLFGYRDGEPYLARGGNYDSFAAVTDAELVAGRAPSAPDEAVVGVDAAETLDLEPGDELTMGGSTEAGVAQVTVVGTYETGGIDDHQVLVPLETARHLTTVQAGQVNIIRTETAVSTSEEDTEPIVLGVDAPRYIKPGETIQFEVTVWNPGTEYRETAVSAALGDAGVTQNLTLESQERRTVTFEMDAPGVGDYELAIGSVRQPLTVTEALPINVMSPSDVQPGERVQVRVSDASDTPVESGSISLANSTVSFNGDGRAWIQTPETGGSYELVARSDDGQEARQRIQVTSDASRTLLAETTLTPAEPTIHVRPTASVTVWNPWDTTAETTVTVAGPGTDIGEQVTLGPGEQTTLTAGLERRPPGEYSVRVSADGQVVSTDRYQVSGDERLGAALAASGHYGGGGGLGNAIEYAIGNLSVLLAALVGLTAITVIGAMSAVLARAVREKRQVIGVYRATGASPRRILKIVLSDTARIGAVSSLLAVGIAIVVTSVLAEFGLLTAFGIALDPQPSPRLAAGLVVGSVALTVTAAFVVTISIVRTPVRTLLKGATRSATRTSEMTAAVSSPAESRRPDGDREIADEPTATTET